MSTPFKPSSRSQLKTPGGSREGKLSQSDISRMLPRQISSGSTRGTQIVGYGNTKIDGSNNRITVGDSIILDGNNDTITVESDNGSQLGMGKIPGTDPAEFGFFSMDSNGQLIMKIIDGTKYVYNPSDNYVNVTQDGLLPDGSGGFVVAKAGNNVADAYS